jgi:serine protease Do
MKTRSHFCAALSALVLSTAAWAADDMKPETRTLRGAVGPGPGPARGKMNPNGPDQRVFFKRGEPEKEIVTFLGVDTGPVSPTLTAQLNLPEGSGLVVNHIEPASPAAGVLQEHDVLLKLDDQLLVERRQLAVLVRNHKEGDEVTLTYIRGGKQTTGKIKLTKHEVPKFSMDGPDGPGPGDIFERRVSNLTTTERREDVDHVLDLLGRARGPNVAFSTESPTRVRIEQRGSDGLRAVAVNTANSNLVFTDDEGSLELTMKDGKKTLVAKNPKGEGVFSGPVTTPEERKALPESVRGRLEKLEGMQNVTFRTDDAFEGAETRVVRPMPRGIAMPLPAPGPDLRPGRPAFF